MDVQFLREVDDLVCALIFLRNCDIFQPATDLLREKKSGKQADSESKRRHKLYVSRQPCWFTSNRTHPLLLRSRLWLPTPPSGTSATLTGDLLFSYRRRWTIYSRDTALSLVGVHTFIRHILLLLECRESLDKSNVFRGQLYRQPRSQKAPETCHLAFHFQYTANLLQVQGL